jgi:hypothetical protein
MSILISFSESIPLGKGMPPNLSLIFKNPNIEGNRFKGVFGAKEKDNFSGNNVFLLKLMDRSPDGNNIIISD